MIWRSLAEGRRDWLPQSYGASEGLKTVMVEQEAPGGQAGLSSRIENYLGFPLGLVGRDLAAQGGYPGPPLRGGNRFSAGGDGNSCQWSLSLRASKGWK